MKHWTDDENLEFEPVVHVPGYRFRTVIPMNDVLYDPAVGDWVEEDGRIPVCDVGGQSQHTRFDPDLGHGAIWWLTHDGRLEAAVPWGNTHLGMPMFPRLAPKSFGRWAGHAFIVAQVQPGRRGAHLDHVVYKWDRRSDQIVLFAVVPRTDSKAGHGIPYALISGGFGPEGTEQEGWYYFPSLGNASIYRVDPKGTVEVVAILDGRDGNPAMLPRCLFFASDMNFPEHQGKLIVGGVPNAAFDIGSQNQGRQVGQQVSFHVFDNGRFSADAFHVGNRMMAWPVRAPAEGFGPLGGRCFYSEQGATVQSQSIYDHGALPHDGAIVYRDDDGVFQPLVTGLRGGRNDLIMAGDRLIISHFGKSYSTGEFHEPDGAMWEVTYVGEGES